MNVSTTLLLSLRKEIIVLNELIENLPKSHENRSLNSWLFPSKSYDFVCKYIHSKPFKEASYQNYLEITIDRLYVIIRLIILHIDSFIIIKGSKISALIVSPNRPTVAYCTKLLWTRILAIMEKKATNKTTNVSVDQEYCDNESQTEIISLNRCDSCSSAMLCMKKLLHFFEQTNDCNERLRIKYKIFDITQFGCMLKVTSSIEDSLNTLFKQLQDKKRKNDLLKLENEKFKTELQAFDRKIAFSKEEVDILREKLGNGNQEMIVLRQEINKFKAENNLMLDEIRNLHNFEENLNADLKSIKQENAILKRRNDSLQTNFETTLQLLSQHVLKLNKRTAILDSEYELVKRILDQYEQSILGLNVKLLKLTKNIDKIDLKIRYRYGCMEEILQSFLKYEDFCVKIKKTFKEKLDFLKESNEKLPEVAKFKGNPIEDFTKQIEENKSKIKALENENVKLQQLLNRFKNKKSGQI